MGEPFLKAYCTQCHNPQQKKKKKSKLINRSLTDQPLNDSMKALDPFKQRMMILQGLSGQMVNGGHISGYGAMNCVKGSAGHRTIANWWMTLLHAAGKSVDDFGMKDAKIPAAAQKGPLAELLA